MIKIMRNKFFTKFTLAVLLLLPFSFVATSCLDDDSDFEEQVRIDDQKINKYLTDNNIVAQKHNSGIYYRKLQENNTGTSLNRGNVVSFYYTVSLFDSTVLQSISREKGDKPLQFCLQSNTMVPQGLDYGIGLMKVGEKYQFFVPSYLAYGSYSCAYFQVNTNFIIDIEVTGVETENDLYEKQIDSIKKYADLKYPGQYEQLPSGLFFIDSIPGTGFRPYMGSRVDIDFTRKYLNDSIISSVTGASFFLDHMQAVQGLEEGIKLMKEGGYAILLMPAKLGFNESLCVIPQKVRKELLDDRVITSEVEPYSILKYVVRLRNTN